MFVNYDIDNRPCARMIHYNYICQYRPQKIRFNPLMYQLYQMYQVDWTIYFCNALSHIWWEAIVWSNTDPLELLATYIQWLLQTLKQKVRLGNCRLQKWTAYIQTPMYNGCCNSHFDNNDGYVDTIIKTTTTMLIATMELTYDDCNIDSNKNPRK